MAKNAATVAAKWVRGMQNAAKSMTEGVAAVSEAPGAKAAAAADLYLQKVQEAVANGKFADNSRAVSLEEWRRAMTEKGIPRVGQGATAATQKQERFFAWLLPIAEASKADISTMPKGNPEASKARMIRNMENMMRNKYRRGR
jgi:hypothetical protein